MSSYIELWFAKFLVDCAIGLACLSPWLIWWAKVSIIHAWKHRNCKHIEFRETGACDAICCACGKNLGFIGSVRDARRGKA